MPDLNELLRWSIINSTAANQQEGGATAAQPGQSEAQAPTVTDPANEQMTLRFRPTANPAAASSALHPNDSQYRPPGMPYDEDDSPPSSAGPATPKEGTSLLPGQKAPLPPSHLNSEIIDLILGRPDSAVMKEKMEIAMDESRPVDERVEALDDFEMLIEHIDNANNLVVLKMWEPLMTLLSSSSPEIVTNALWIIGTSVQNNVKAQAALYQNNVLPLILSLIYPSASSSSASSSASPTPVPARSVRAKATYAFSSAVKAWPLASAALASNDHEGYAALKRGVQDEDLVVRRKMAFLVNTLLLQSEETFEGEMPKEVVEMLKEQAPQIKRAGTLVEGLKTQGVVEALAGGLAGQASSSGGSDLEFEENAMRALSQAAGKGGLSDSAHKQVKAVWEQWGAAGQEERGLSGEDGKHVQRLLDIKA